MKKLHLNRETVRELSENQLGHVQGASGPGHTCNPGICYELPSKYPCPYTSFCETDLCPPQTRGC